MQVLLLYVACCLVACLEVLPPLLPGSFLIMIALWPMYLENSVLDAGGVQ